ncbi:MAG TPA: OmpA family protein, partial [Planctomycetota bacterium]|nr:OmpA family protein [Planctomycetota bacterium]
MESAIDEEGRRIERPRGDDRRRGERRDRGEVVREFGDRIIIRLGDEIHVERRDRDRRLERNARDVYYEELSNGRTREVVERANGVRVVTIRDRYGDIVHRARILPDGREIVLFHVDRRNYERMHDDRRAGWDLPPMHLNVPVEEYILEARRVRDREDYYRFLRQPPVERVERTYSVSEVTQSPRIRDKARRIDLDTINFDFNSSVIAESEVAKLDDVAWAIERLLEENPGETFLIEGHTDAVGSDLYNLALSDQRADAVI